MDWKHLKDLKTNGQFFRFRPLVLTNDQLYIFVMFYFHWVSFVSYVCVWVRVVCVSVIICLSCQSMFGEVHCVCGETDLCVAGESMTACDPAAMWCWGVRTVGRGTYSALKGCNDTFTTRALFLQTHWEAFQRILTVCVCECVCGI